MDNMMEQAWDEFDFILHVVCVVKGTRIEQIGMNLPETK